MKTNKLIICVFAIFIILISALASAGTFNFNVQYVDSYYANGQSKPSWVRAGDMNNDGDIDIVVGGNSSLYVYENNQGSWQVFGNLDSSGIGSSAAVLYDVNSDGYLDVVSAKYYGDVGWWENPGTLTNSAWQFHELRQANWFLVNLELADIDKDNTEELVAAWYNSYWSDLSQIRIEILEEEDAIWQNHLVESNRISQNNNHAGLDIGDIDQDGKIDIAYSNGWYKQDESGSWTWNIITDEIANISNTKLGDIDNDKDLDVVVSAGHHSQGVYWFENMGENWQQHTLDADIVHPEGLVVVDLDNDEDLDVIATELFVDSWNQPVHNLYVFENLGEDEWEKHNIAPNSYPNHLIQAADINEDGLQDIISEGAGCSIVSYYENAGPETEPKISSVSGKLQTGENIMVAGSGFGTKQIAEPLRWDNFEDEIAGQSIGGNWQLSAGEVDGMAYYTQPLYTDENQRTGSEISSWHNLTSSIVRESGFGLVSEHGWQELYISFWRKLDMGNLNGIYLIDLEITGDSGTKTGYHGSGIPSLSHEIDSGQTDISLQADYNQPYPGIGGADILNIPIFENNVWTHIETWIRVGDPNQALKYWQDSELKIDYTTEDFPWNVGPYLGDDNSKFNKIWLGYYIDGTSLRDSSVQLDDVYIDTSQARIELCNVPEWYNKQQGAHCEIQIPTTWSDNSIAFRLNKGSFSDGATAYLYVIDSKGNVNENGYPISFSAGTLQTCSKQNGDICSLSESCFGSWLSASDTTRCCSVACVLPDTTPPIRNNGKPTGQLPSGTTSTTLSLNTNEIAECRYSTTANSLFNSMTKFTNTNALQHSTLLTSLQDGKNYDYYVKCRDAVGNINAVDEKISFSVEKEQSFDFFYIVSPVNGSVYNSRRVRFVIEGEKRATYYYFDATGNTETRRILCSKCMRINKTVSFEDGYNNITIEAIAEDGGEAEQEIEFFVDGRKPRIRRIEPRSGFMGSVFTVEYDEVNIKEVKLEYDNYATGYKTEILECPEGKNQECGIEVNLEAYDGQQIEYWFSIKDAANNYAESRHIKVNVDTTYPVINHPLIKGLDYKIEGRYVYFNMSIDEDNLDSVEYKDWSESMPRWRTLCTRLKNGVCKKKLGFRYGSRDLDIQVTDKAGNAVSENIFFEI